MYVYYMCIICIHTGVYSHVHLCTSCYIEIPKELHDLLGICWRFPPLPEWPGRRFHSWMLAIIAMAEKCPWPKKWGASVNLETLW